MFRQKIGGSMKVTKKEKLCCNCVFYKSAKNKKTIELFSPSSYHYCYRYPRQIHSKGWDDSCGEFKNKHSIFKRLQTYGNVY